MIHPDPPATKKAVLPSKPTRSSRGNAIQNAVDAYFKKYPNAEQRPMLLLRQQEALLDQLIKTKPCRMSRNT
jgi:hypothetical protein